MGNGVHGREPGIRGGFCDRSVREVPLGAVASFCLGPVKSLVGAAIELVKVGHRRQVADADRHRDGSDLWEGVPVI